MRKSEDIQDVEADFYKLDREIPSNLETATLAMGCFWGVEALFGGIEGVYRTRVGYTGGDKENPSYRSLGNHTESLQIDFNPEEISYKEILKVFLENHNYKRNNKTQYASKIFCNTPEQKRIAEEIIPGNAATSIEELETFWIAEDYHQKYRLRGTREDEKILEHYSKEQFINSTLAAKLNAAKASKLQHSVEDKEFKDIRN